MDNCAKAVADELGLDKKDVAEIAERLKKAKARLSKLNAGDRVDEQLRKLAAEEGEKARIAAALRRKQAALNIIASDAWDRDIEKLMGDGMTHAEAVVANLVGDYRNTTNARKSVSARRTALEGRWLDGLLKEMRDDPDLQPVIKLLNQPKAIKPLMDNVTREMFEIKPDGKIGLTKDPVAKKLAALLAKYQEARRIEATNAGANIGKLDGRAPQSHDGVKMLRAGQETWVDKIFQRLDLQRSFPSLGDDEIKKRLRSIYLNITTGEDLDITPTQKGQKLGPYNLANSLEKHRVLHFKSADDWLAYADEFGRGNVWTASVDEMHGMARKVALMEKMGANPETFLRAKVEDARKLIRKQADEGKISAKEAAKQIEKLSMRGGFSGTQIGKAWAEVSGETLAPVPGNVTWAHIWSTTRALQSVSKLGFAPLSSITDMVTFAHRLRYHGKGLLEGYSDAIQGLFAKRGPNEQDEIALLLGVAADSFTGQIHARYAGYDSLPGWVSRAQNAFFKHSGLTWWTDRLTNAFARTASAHMALRAAQSWDQLDAAFKSVLGIHGFDERHWGVIRQALYDGEDGVRYIVPQQVRELPDEAFDGLIGDDWKQAKNPDARRARLIEKARRDMELDLTAFFVDEASFGVIKGDDRTRMTTLQGTKQGSTIGEIFRFIMQFKSFPVAYIQKVLGPSFRAGVLGKTGGVANTRDIGGLASLIAMSTVFGYVAMTVKDWLKNRTARDPRKFETLAAAFVQGGGLGIYGDFFFGKASRFGNSVLETAVGPTGSSLADLISLWQKTKSGEATKSDYLYLGVNHFPYANLWWGRAALDLAVLNDFQEYLSPGTFRRRERGMQKDFGQSYLLDPLRPSRDLPF